MTIPPESVEQKPSSMTDVMKYFGMRPAEFKQEWQKLTDKDKADLKQWLDDLRKLLSE